MIETFAELGEVLRKMQDDNQPDYAVLSPELVRRVVEHGMSTTPDPDAIAALRIVNPDGVLHVGDERRSLDMLRTMMSGTMLYDMRKAATDEVPYAFSWGQRDTLLDLLEYTSAADDWREFIMFLGSR